MGIIWNEASIPGRHTLCYRMRDANRTAFRREVDVLAAPAEIQTFLRDGYLVRESLLPMEEVERLRAALDETVARDERQETSGGKSFGGVFVRHLADKHPAFLELPNFPPAVSLARALFGLAVTSRGFTARVCYPDDPHQEVEWHFHQRIVLDPLPPLFPLPQTLDTLLYLDDIGDRNGPLCVLPGSHLWTDHDLPNKQWGDKPGQQVLRFPAGSCVLAHGSLWHRALPTQPGGTKRRLLLFGYGPAHVKPSIYGQKPVDGLTTQLLQDPDLPLEMRELLGVAGFM